MSSTVTPTPEERVASQTAERRWNCKERETPESAHLRGREGGSAPAQEPSLGGGCAEPRCLHRSFVSVALPSTWSWLQTIQRSVIQSEAVTFSGLHRDRRGPCYLVGRGKDPAIYLRVMWKIYVQCFPWSLPHVARQMVALINNVIHSQSGKSP